MKLFKPIKTNNMKIKNRIIAAPVAIGVMSLGLDNETEQIVNYYSKRADGGAGAVILGAVSPSLLIAGEKLGQNIPPSRYIANLSMLADCVQRCGAKFGVQLICTNRYPYGALGPTKTSQQWVAPADVTKEDIALWYIPVERLRALTQEEIEAIISRFARASVLLKNIGVDFVELHLAHGHLGNQFFSPVINQRRDKYGGSLSGRMQFGLECVRAMRKAVGPSYPLWVRIGAVDERPHGITLEESVAFARKLEKTGADCLDISVGVSIKRSYDNYVQPLKKEPMGTYISLAHAVKRVVNVPVVGVGRINNMDLAEEILKEGKADLIAIGRQLICDPYWPKKVKENRTKEVITCNSCNWCCKKGVDLIYRKDRGCRQRLGITTVKHKMLVLTLSAFLTGLAGVVDLRDNQGKMLT